MGFSSRVKFSFSLTATEKGEHWDVEARKYSERSNVHRPFSNINVGLNDEDWVLEHEFGHALGLPDEYDECVDGDKMWALCHLDNLKRATEHFKDRGGLMGAGTSLRARYFHKIRDYLNRWTQWRYMFQVRPLGTADSVREDAPTPPGGGRRVHG